MVQQKNMAVQVNYAYSPFKGGINTEVAQGGEGGVILSQKSNPNQKWKRLVFQFQNPRTFWIFLYLSKRYFWASLVLSVTNADRNKNMFRQVEHIYLTK